MRTKLFNPAINLLAGAALLLVTTSVFANDNNSVLPTLNEENKETAVVETAVEEAFRLPVITNAEPVSGWSLFNERVARNISYPEYLQQLGIEATINVEFVVNSYGKIEILRTDAAYPLNVNRVFLNFLKEETKSAVITSFGDWRPSTVDGEPITSSAFIIPVKFKVDYLSIL